MRWIGFVALLAITDISAAPQPKTQIMIWATVAPDGDATYGGGAMGAMVFEQRDVDVAANGEARIPNIAGTADPVSMQLRDLTDPKAKIIEQRLVPAAKTATEMIARRIGEHVTVVTPKGAIGGVLRGVDDRNLVLETGTGDARRISVMRREYALDVRLPGGATGDKPGVVWKLATTKPGKHAIELTYRAGGITWTPAYVAVLDDSGKQVDLAAWATVRNESGVTFDRATITLLNPSPLAKQPPAKFTLPHPVKLTDAVVQLEMLRVSGAKVRTIAVYEAMPDPSSEASEAPGTDCMSNNGTADDGGSSGSMLEIALPPPQIALPDGQVRMYRRRGTRLEPLGVEELRTVPGAVRVKSSAPAEITGERRAVSCNVDERAHTIHERIEVKIANRSAQPIDVIAREYLWRWPVVRVENETKKGTRTAPQTMEYRVRIAAKSSQTLQYTAVYTW